MALCQMGIYKIANLINGKKYVGSCRHFPSRKAKHLWALKNNRHYNKHLQYAWNKYGENNFEFAFMEQVSEISNLYIREQYYCDTIKPEYNKRLLVDSNYGTRRKMTENHKLSISKGNRKKATPENIIRIFELRSQGLTQVAIGKIIGIDSSLVSRVLNKRRRYEL